MDDLYKMRAILLTGATGLLGRYLLRDLLLAGRRVVVLVRGRPGDPSGTSRLDQVLRPFEVALQRTLPRPLVIRGTLHEDQLGLRPVDQELVGTLCTAVLHCAASVKFEHDPLHDEPYASNVRGTARLLDLCRAAGIQEFHHVSTAYVCGDRTGTIRESDFDHGQGFRNAYEWSKYQAEKLLREANDLRSLTIYRPSIIVGDSTTGFSSTFHGFYLPLQLAYAAAAAGYRPASGGFLAALGLAGHERKNLVPVDWVSAAITRLVQTPERHGATYHLTNPLPVAAERMQTCMGDAIGRALPDASHRPARSLAPAALTEFQQQMAVYQDYLRDDPDFDARQARTALADLPCPEMHDARLRMLAEFAIQSRFGVTRPPGDGSGGERPAEVAAQLARLAERPAHRHPAWILEVSGAGGGWWPLSWENPPATLRSWRQADGKPRAIVYMNVYMWNALFRRELTVPQALHAGGVVVEGRGEAVSQAAGCLRALFAQIHQSQ